ncbi:MAG: metallopeptidase TldD-related protein, partial [Sulfolobales archaeon]
MNEYKDTIMYEEEKLELAFRDNNYECSKAVTKVSAKREFKDGMWKVISCHGCDINELINMYWELNPPTNLVGNELRDVDFYIGSISLGEPINDLTEVLKTASDVCNELKAVNVEKCELIMNIRKCRRTIIRDFGKASEGKTLMEFTTNIVSRSRRYGYGKVYKVLITKPKIINNTLIDRLIREAYRKSLIDCSSKTLSPLNTGRQTIVLGGGASAALIHELSHLLESTSLNKLNIGHKIGPDELYLYDIPHEPTSPTIRLFDDEGVSTIKRTLIENGTVIDYH